MTKEKIVEKLYGALRVMQDVDVEAVLKVAKNADGRSSCKNFIGEVKNTRDFSHGMN